MLIHTARRVSLAGLPPKRALVLGAANVAAVAVAALQLSPVALFAAARTDTIAGIAAGMVATTVVLVLADRRREAR